MYAVQGAGFGVHPAGADHLAAQQEGTVLEGGEGGEGGDGVPLADQFGMHGLGGAHHRHGTMRGPVQQGPGGQRT
ncbi:hypothetical protein ACFWN1_20105 [Streptomyces sp. NPDC058459]|uniref:hypothetical protein n=1 Tax=Streptomyces sp. NPDC058459 TaxID=3346508 RepID=UPI003664CBBC